jgi:hypothetical protein
MFVMSASVDNKEDKIVGQRGTDDDNAVFCRARFLLSLKCVVQAPKKCQQDLNYVS